MKISFHHINLVSKNLEELNNFYKNILKLDSIPEQQFPRTEANQNKGYDGKIKFVTDGNIQLKTYSSGGSATAALTISSGATHDVTIDTGDLIMSTGNIYMRNSNNPDVIKYQGTPHGAADDAAELTAANILTGIITVFIFGI